MVLQLDKRKQISSYLFVITLLTSSSHSHGELPAARQIADTPDSMSARSENVSDKLLVHGSILREGHHAELDDVTLAKSAQLLAPCPLSLCYARYARRGPAGVSRVPPSPRASSRDHGAKWQLVARHKELLNKELSEIKLERKLQEMADPASQYTQETKRNIRKKKRKVDKQVYTTTKMMRRADWNAWVNSIPNSLGYLREHEPERAAEADFYLKIHDARRAVKDRVVPRYEAKGKGRGGPAGSGKRKGRGQRNAKVESKQTKQPAPEEIDDEFDDLFTDKFDDLDKNLATRLDLLIQTSPNIMRILAMALIGFCAGSAIGITRAVIGFYRSASTAAAGQS